MTYNVKVQVWLGANKDNNGIINFLKVKGFGGSVGHAAIEINIPANALTKELVEQYCHLSNNNTQAIPFEKTTLHDGKKRVPVYQIRWSYWPGHALEDTIEDDRFAERSGVHFETSQEMLERLKLTLEERYYSGTVGSQEMTLAPSIITHYRHIGRDTPKGRMLTTIHHTFLLQNKTRALEKLIKKFETHKKEIKDESYILSPSERKMFNNLFPTDIRTNILSKDKLNINDLKMILDVAQTLLTECCDSIEEYNEILMDTYSKIIQQGGNQARVLCKLHADKRRLLYAIDVLRNHVGGRLILDNDYDDLSSYREVLDIATSGNEGCLGKVWKDLLNENIGESLSVDQVNVLIEKLTEISEKVDVKINEKNESGVSTEKTFEQAIYRDFTSIGSLPDAAVTLPIKANPQRGIYTKREHGMDVESMLRKMRDLINSHDGFRLFGKNCSETSLQILSSGSAAFDLNYYSDRRTLGYAYPSLVLKISKQLSLHLSDLNVRSSSQQQVQLDGNKMSFYNTRRNSQGFNSAAVEDTADCMCRL